MKDHFIKFNLKPELIIPILVSCVIFMEFLDITIINTAVPTIAHDFSISPILLKFSVASYFLSLAIFIPISGWCADKFGTKFMFLSSVALFVLASLLCGIAHNSIQLTCFRFLQGIGGAFMNPVARIIILRLFPPKDLLRIQGIIFTPAMFGYVLGPFFGGFLTSYLSWHWIFYINVPFGLLIIYFGQKHIEQYVNQQSKKFDLFGFIIAGLALSALTFFVEMLNHYELVSQKMVFLSGLAGIILFIILIIYCLNRTNAIFDFSLLKIKTFRIGSCTYLSSSIIMASMSFLLPLMYQECFHIDPVKSGMLVMPIALGFLFSRSLAVKIISRFGFKYTLRLNLFLVMFWIILLAQITSTTSISFIIITEFFFGGSLILVNSCAGALNYLEMPNDKVSIATSMDLTLRQFSSSLGIGISAFCLTSLSQSLSLNIFDSSGRIFHYTYYLMAGIAFIGLVSGRTLTQSDGNQVLKSKSNHNKL